MNFDSSDSGQIIGNTLKGGTVSLWNGPWQILNNDYQGTPSNTVSYSVFFIRNEHDVLIREPHPFGRTRGGDLPLPPLRGQRHGTGLQQCNPEQ